VVPGVAGSNPVGHPNTAFLPHIPWGRGAERVLFEEYA
jgi:hypothetical protein